MKITAPLSAVTEIEMLLHCGADEIYCGIHPPEWDRYAGEMCWINRRAPAGANLTTLSSVREVTEQAHDKGVRVHITLNTPFYAEDGLSYVANLAFELAEKARIDAVIINDFNLLLELNRMRFPAGIHLSSLGGCMNSHAVSFYRSLNVRRIILPRQLQYREIRRILENTDKGMEFEVFAVNDGCFYEEAFCRTTHGAGGPFCLEKAQLRPISADKAAISSEALRAHIAQTREYLWYQNNCGSSFQADGIPNGPCSLCGFGHFRDWGVHTVKVIGREASFYRKMRSLQLVKAVMDEVRAGTAAEEIPAFAQKVRNTPEYCQKGFMCYFKGT